MRKLFLAMAAVAALLASCSKDDAVIDTPTEGAETTVTFDISTPELATRYGEGNNATTLEWYVYEFDGSNYKNVEGLNGTKTFQKQTTVGIKFLMGRTYHVLFWAHANGAPYKVDPSDATMTVDYDKMEANNEDYDAFYKFHEVGLVTTATQGGTVELTRPFAQLNIATADSEDAEKAGYALDKTGIEVKVYSTMNFKTGNVGGHEVRTFKPAAKATGEITVSGTKYDIISMNYLLVNQKETPDVTLSLQEANSDETLTRVYTTVPVQRNHRTYILGNVFTKPAEFNVIIKEGFIDDNYEEWDGATYEKIEAGADGYYSVSHAAELAYIFRDVDKSKNDVKIRLEADINFGGHTIPAWSGDNNINGYKVVLEGNGNRIFNFKSAAVGTRATADYQIAGLFDIACGAEISNLTIEDATIDAGNSAESYAGALIGKVSAGVAKLTNVTVLNSSVTGTCKVGGLVGFATADDACLEIENCHVKNTDITTNNVADESGQAGGLVGYIANGKNTISNSSVVGGTFNVVNSKNNAAKANSKFVGVVAGTTDLVIENCIIDETGMTWNETGATSYVSPYGELVGGNRGTATVVIDGVEYVAANDVAQFIAAFENVEEGEVISLSSNVNFTEDNRTSLDGWYEGIYYEGDKSFTIDLNGQTIGDENGVINDYMLLFKNNGDKANTITIKNGTIDAGSKAYSALCTSTSSTQTITINLENVELINNNSNGAVIKIRGGAVLNVNDGTTITGTDSYVGIESYNATVNIYDGAEIYMLGKTSYNGCLVGVSGDGTVNVYGGYGEGAKGGFIAMTSGGTINAKGGEWIANTDGSIASDNNAVLLAQNDKNSYPSGGKSIVNVTGGTYKGGYNCYGDVAGNAQIHISGGNFNADPSTYVEAGYKATQNTDGSWTVAAE